MKSKIKSILGNAIIIFPAICFLACSDEIVKTEDPVTPLDTIQMFNYRIDTLARDVAAQFDVLDTNNGYFPMLEYGFYYYNDLKYRIYSYSDPDFSPSTTDAYDKNNVFIGGLSNTDISRACKLSKFDGNAFTNYTFPQDDTNRTVEDILAIGPNEAWVSTLNNVVYHFRSGLFEKYTLDSGFQTGTLFEQNNEIFIIANKYFRDTTINVMHMTINFTYKFTGSKFSVIDIDTTYDPHLNLNNGLTNYVNKCGDKEIRVANSSLYYFNGNKWEFLMATPFQIYYLAGESKDNMVCYGYDPITHQRRFWVRKNDKWFYESTSLPFPLLYPKSPLFYAQGRYYILFAPGQNLFHTLVVQLMPVK